MNWDTEETMNWIESDEIYWNVLKLRMANEMEFISALLACINNINIFKLGIENHINSSNVNGNEIYIHFCELNGIETEGWN